MATVRLAGILRSSGILRLAGILSVAAGLVLAFAAPAQKAADGWLVAPKPNDAFGFVIFHGDKEALSSGMRGWTPNFGKYIGFAGKSFTIEGDSFVCANVADVGGSPLACKETVAQSGGKAVTWQYVLSAEKDIPLTMFASEWGIAGGAAGELEVTAADGAAKTLPFPLGRTDLGKPAAKAVFKFKEFGNLTFTFDPPVDLGFDKSVRIQLAGALLPAGPKTVKVTATADTPLRFAFKPEDRAALNTVVAGADWYALQDVKDVGPSVIGLDNWLPKPAGAKGRIKMVGDHFEAGDGKPIKFWGADLCYGAIVPKQADADYNGQRFAKYGINCVRLHKFLGLGDNYGIGDKNDSTKFADVPLAKFDYHTATLAKNGVYYTFSPFFGFEVRPGNKDKVVAYDEIAQLKGTSAYSVINYAEDIQDLVAEMYTNLLSHVNPNTGKKYAEDPALASVEIQNEDDIFFSSMKTSFTACPTYAKILEKRFAEWLQAKYGSDDKLKTAWEGALKPGEALAAGTMAVQNDPWFEGSSNLPKQTGGARQRLLDNAAFLHATQDKYYTKLVKAIRATGYDGVIIGSPWQATSMLPHYYNLLSDATVGLVDRHNYFDGLSASMLAKPGSGYLGTGMQQVLDHPFSVSEWIHVWPALYAAEGPAIMAAYGMGLQDWDASWEFQSNGKVPAGTAMRPTTGTGGFDVWNVDTPANLGQYPALARMILRGDVKPGDVISSRQVSDDNLATGKFDFEDKVTQSAGAGDVKVFTSTCPPEALAAGRVGVLFTGDQPAKSTFPDMAKYDKNGVVVSTTGQLAWDHTGQGFFTVNTPGTKAAVGFHTGKPLVCDTVTITPAAQFASIFVTALEPDKTLANCKGALVTAMARQTNTGFSYFLDQSISDEGKAPTLLEPVKATIEVKGRKIAAVNVLSHEGKRVQGQTVKVEGASFTIDTGRDKSFYYEVVFAE
jgi:hypothetical protein